MGRKENPGESFLSLAHNFHASKSGGKSGEESVVKALLPKYPLPTSTTTQRCKIRRKHRKIKHTTIKTKTQNLIKRFETQKQSFS